MIQVSDPSQKTKIRLMKLALVVGAIWGGTVIYLLVRLVINTSR